VKQKHEVKCKICLEQAWLVVDSECEYFLCDRCGEFIIEGIPGLASGLQESRVTQEVRYKLSAWIREKREMDMDRPVINRENLDMIINNLPNYSPSEKQMKLLRNIARKTRYPGESIELNIEKDYPLAWALNYQEFVYYLYSLKNRELLELRRGGRTFSVKIAPKGWDLLEETGKQLRDTYQVFVAMSFSSEMTPIYEEAVYPAIYNAGYDPYRIDMEPHAERIDAKIVAEIRNSRFVVADVTEQKQGVYFEAGYALGMGLPVIWSVREDDLEKVHFDTRQYNHIVWRSKEDFKEKLCNFICAIIGRGKHRERN